MSTRKRYRSRGQRALFSRATWMRLLLVGPAALALGWLCVAVSAANVLGPVRPDLALALAPWDARAEARSAEGVLAGAAGPDGNRALAEAVAEARLVLQRDPTIPSAWRTLALGANQDARTLALFQFSANLSKRDLPTQLWLIEERVQHNDIVGALQHYDIALRTSPASFDVLFPVLIHAIGEDGIVAPLAGLLRENPPWRRWFLESLATGSPNPDRLVTLMSSIGGPATADETNIMAGMVRRLVEQRAYQPARALYGVLAGAAASRSLVQNGDFERPSLYPPFDWELQPGDELRAELQPAADNRSGVALDIHSSSGAAGMAARQLLVLPPGTYEVTAQVGADAGIRPARLYWQVTCGDAQHGSLGINEFAVPATRTMLRSTIHVPAAGCPAQWLQLGARAVDGADDSSGWIDSVMVTPVGSE